MRKEGEGCFLQLYYWCYAKDLMNLTVKSRIGYLRIVAVHLLNERSRVSCRITVQPLPISHLPIPR